MDDDIGLVDTNGVDTVGNDFGLVDVKCFDTMGVIFGPVDIDVLDNNQDNQHLRSPYQRR
jgi:hypothetical protein